MSGFMNNNELLDIGFAALGSNVQIDRTARFYGASRISVGSNVRIDAYSIISAGEEGIKIGNHIHIAVYVFLTGQSHIEICDFAGLSGKVSIYSSNDDYSGEALTGPTIPEQYRRVSSKPVKVGRHAIIGAGSIILPGAVIGEGASIGALSLVKKDVPPFTIVVGQPAKPIGARKKDFLKYEQLLLNNENLLSD